jgi:hypothetical protein
LPNRKRRSNIQINKLGLFINGNHISAPPRSVALFACLYANLGRIVPYRQLVIVLGYNPARPAGQKHLLRQYMLTIKSTLSAHKVPYVLAVARNVGYGLCELADNHGLPASWASKGSSLSARPRATAAAARPIASRAKNPACKAVSKQPSQNEGVP